MHDKKDKFLEYERIIFFFYLLGRDSYLFNGALIKPGWVLTVANVLQVKKGVTSIKPNRLQVILGM